MMELELFGSRIVCCLVLVVQGIETVKCHFQHLLLCGVYDIQLK